MIDPKRRYQDKCMLKYWKDRDDQEDHEEVYQGSSTYMMQQVGGLRYCSMRQRARRVKLMLDWGVHGRRMKLMGLDDSGLCLICMETDSLNHIAFDCHYSGALHKRQAWIAGIHDMIQHRRRQQQQRTWRVDSAKEEIYLELQDMYTRHSHKLFLWRGLWPTFLRQNLSDRLHITTSGAHWAQDKYRKILARAIQLFGKLSFTTLQEINGLRHKVALQITVRLNQLPTVQSQHIPRIPHAQKAHLPRELGIPPEEVKILVERLLYAKQQRTGGICEGRCYDSWKEAINETTRNG